jgi:20S proteasome alpha/beta subunit
LTIQSQLDSYDYGLEILIGGVDSEVAHIYSIDAPGTSKCFDAIGFHAIGSGLPHAINTFIAKDYNQSFPLREALLIIYEAKKISEKAPGVGENITDISVISNKRIINFP